MFHIVNKYTLYALVETGFFDTGFFDESVFETGAETAIGTVGAETEVGTVGVVRAGLDFFISVHPPSAVLGVAVVDTY
jgi:hypothetical protein